MAANLPTPRRVFAHGWWTNEGQKISKSLGNVIDPMTLVERYGLDQVRYFLLREIPFGNDGDFSHKALVNRMNGELANDLGNLAQRVLSMIAKNCAASVPQPQEFSDADRQLLGSAQALLDKTRNSLDQQLFHEMLENIWQVIRAANAYVDHQAPWALRKTDPARMATVLYVLAETIRHLGILLQPVMPQTMARLLDQLVVAPEDRSFEALARPLVAGTLLPAPQGIFPRFVEEEGEKA